jgi:hypothetical protein
MAGEMGTSNTQHPTPNIERNALTPGTPLAFFARMDAGCEIGAPVCDRLWTFDRCKAGYKPARPEQHAVHVGEEQLHAAEAGGGGDEFSKRHGVQKPITETTPNA